VVSAGYFRTLRIPLRGRDFDRRDDGDARPVAIVSEAFARRHWPGLDPLGRQLGLDDDDSPWLTVIGVAGDVRADGLDEDARPTVYVPLAQSRFGFYPDWGMDLVVRSTRDPAALAAAVRGVVRVEDGGLPVFAVATLEERLRDSLARRRQTLALLGCFAATALGLSALGLYGVMAHRTRLRTREIGVRLALGARPGGIVSLVLKEGLVLVLVGGVLGLAGGVAVGRVAQALLYETSPLDPTTMAAAAALLLAVALLAVLLPARRAARVDPLEALRQE
jgi:predicted permease